MNKNLLRKEMKKLRDELSESEIKSLSEKIFKTVEKTQEYISAKNIFVFLSFGSEVYTHDFIKKSLELGKNIFIPHIDLKEKIMYSAILENFDDLEVGFYDILSLPESKISTIEPEEIDLVIVPGLIFGKNFYRIGYGGGFYDKFMSSALFKAKKIGICFDFQLVDNVESDFYDIPVDTIITNERKIEREKNE